MIRTQVEVNI